MSPRAQTVHGPSAPTRLLAFDTATERLCLGLACDAGEFTLDCEGGAAASATLLPQTRVLLERAGIGWQALQAIAFGSGPGAFTGLRTACAVAQGLGLGLDLPLLPLDSLLIVAEDARLQLPASSVIDVGVAMDARMDEAYAALYRWAEHRWQVLQPPALISLSQLADAWSGLAAHAWAGSALSAFGERLPLPPTQRLPQQRDRAGAMLRLARAAAGAGLGVDAGSALPIYLRDKVAFTTLEREAQRRTREAAA